MLKKEFEELRTKLRKAHLNEFHLSRLIETLIKNDRDWEVAFNTIVEALVFESLPFKVQSLPPRDSIYFLVAQFPNPEEQLQELLDYHKRIEDPFANDEIKEILEG